MQEDGALGEGFCHRQCVIWSRRHVIFSIHHVIGSRHHVIRSITSRDFLCKSRVLLSSRPSFLQVIVRHDFQKFGFSASLRWKESYHCRTALYGMNVSDGLGCICACVTLNDDVKLTRFSIIFCVNSWKLDRDDAVVLDSGVW